MCHGPRFFAFLVVMALALTASVEAQPTPLGDERQVNTTTSGAQLAPDVTAEGDQFMVVWQSGSVVSGQRFEPSGVPRGIEFTIPASDNYAQRDPRAVLDDDGGFVVQWRSAFQSTYYLVSAIRARSFEPDTTPANDAFIVTIAINQYEQFFGHDIQPTDTGTFVAAISDYYNSYMGFPDGGVEARRFTPDGSLVGSDSLASVGGSTASRLHRGENDQFVVAWAETGYGTDYTTFRAQRLDTDGSRLGSAIVIPAPQSAGGDRPDVAMAQDGSFTVVWSAYNNYGTSGEIYSRRFGANDLPIGIQQRVNSFTPGRQSTPRIARGGDGTHLVVWQSRESPPGATDTDEWSIRGRQLDAAGVPVGDSFQINQATVGDQVRPVVTNTPDGKAYIVVWQSDTSLGTDTDNWSVQSRRYAAINVFRDGFEAGNTSAWDGTVP